MILKLSDRRPISSDDVTGAFCEKSPRVIAFAADRSGCSDFEIFAVRLNEITSVVPKRSMISIVNVA